MRHRAIDTNPAERWTEYDEQLRQQLTVCGGIVHLGQRSLLFAARRIGPGWGLPVVLLFLLSPATVLIDRRLTAPGPRPPRSGQPSNARGDA